MSLDPNKQSRTCGTKVRTGCLTCKSRRLKCPEDFHNGECSRCRRSKRPCQISSGREPELKIVHYVSRPPRSLTYLSNVNEKEGHYFHRFCTWTALDLAGSFSSEFWTRYAVTIALSEPAIKHAVVALAALHEQYQSKKSLAFTDAGMQYPLSQCTKAISLLTKAINSNHRWAFPDTALIACMLFCAFDSMSYHLDSAIQHLKGGINILVEQLQRASGASTPHEISQDVLQPLFIRLDTQGLQLTESLSTDESYPFSCQLQVSRFESVAEAHKAYSESFNLILRTIYDADSDMHIDDLDSCTDGHVSTSRYETKAAEIDLVYSTWCISFDDFVVRGVAAADLQSCMLMQIWRLATNLNVQIDLKKGDTDYDRFHRHFEDVVSLVYEFLLNAAQNHQSTELRGPHSSAASPVDAGHGAFFYHHGPNSGDLRSGNLHLHPDRTPFISSPALDANLHDTTAKLLDQARTARPPYCRHVDLSAEIQLPEMRPSFSFSTGIIVPLYVTISRCRDPYLRRRALTLMQYCKRREGLWDSDLAARLGDRVIQIEERQAPHVRWSKSGAVFEESKAFFDPEDAPTIMFASQLPNEARVRLIRPTFLPDRRSIERYYMGWSGTWQDAKHQDERWIQEEMQW